VSVSLGYALRTMDRLTPPSVCPKRKHRPKRGGFPREQVRDETKQRVPGGKRIRTNRAKTNPKTPRSKCYIRPDGTNPWRPQSK
jgi:hypothetical protein